MMGPEFYRRDRKDRKESQVPNQLG
jgi:hypothetical protein